MHTNELPIDGDLVRDLVDTQFPDWSGLPLDRVLSSGTVHVIYRLGPAMVVRLPRLVEWSAALQRETEILPTLGPLLPVRIPEVVEVGSPTDAYPSMWSVLTWVEGETAAITSVSDTVAVATQLGEFVVAMRSLRIPGQISTNQRARPLADNNQRVSASIAAVANEFDTDTLTGVWETALAAPEWDGLRTWIHADLMPGNLIVAEGELSAVIDFGECAIGNPTYDLIAGWWVFEQPAREAFRRAAQADAASWHRAKGLALSGAVGALAYYAQTNATFAELARITIRRLIGDD